MSRENTIEHDNAMVKLTTEFLNSISYHLSGREDCKGVVYRIAIGMDDDGQDIQLHFNTEDELKNGIFFTPAVKVFPNRRDRKPGSQVSVISHIMLEHFRDTIYDGTDEYGNIRFKEGTLLRGVYVYQPSLGYKRRRWTRVR